MAMPLLLFTGIAALVFICLHVVAQIAFESNWIIFTVVWKAFYNVAAMVAVLLVAWAAAHYLGILPAWTVESWPR